jgi:hypothetical protein
MKHLEGSGAHVLYIGRTVLKDGYILFLQINNFFLIKSSPEDNDNGIINIADGELLL